jgi:glycolate oxidase FAD binding subunit
MAAVDGLPALPPHRWSVDPAALVDVVAAMDSFVAEVGVGVVHASTPQPARPVDPVVRRLNEQVKARFDPTGRLNPGRTVLAGAP